LLLTCIKETCGVSCRMIAQVRKARHFPTRATFEARVTVGMARHDDVPVAY